MSNFTIKIASLDALIGMLRWAKDEGWNPGLFDHLPFQIADPRGFYCGYLDDKPIACISTVRYSDLFAFLGFYIVHPDYRGCGYGLRLWQTAMQLVSRYNVGLDGVMAQQENYLKSGFVLAYNHVRYRGKISSVKTSFSKHIVPASSIPLDLILTYDRLYFPANRDAFLTAWLQLPKSTSLVYIEDEHIKGLGVIRACYQDFRIGPLFADSPAIAEALLLALANEISADIIIDMPEPNYEAIHLAANFNLKPIFETARMYTGFIPETDLLHVYATTTLELG